MADILSRIFILDDVMNNHGNFGFTGDKAEHFKLIDFSVLKRYNYDHSRDIFRNWESGNHAYHH